MASSCVIRGYYIQSKMNGFVLDVKNNGKQGGTPIVAFPLKNGENDDPSNQLWLFEEDGSIKSVATGMVLDIYGGTGGTNLVVWSKKNDENRANQQWQWDAPYIYCPGANKVIDIEGLKTEPLAKVIAHPKNGGLNQQWRLVPKCSMAKKLYHGDAGRDNNFWVYPAHKPLANPQWDTYDPSEICDNFTALDENNCNQVRRYKCNGHGNVCNRCRGC
jgi:hypothetical protein